MLRPHRTWYQGTNANALDWMSVAIAAGACGALGLLDAQQPVACASRKDEDLVEEAKKMVQEFTNTTIRQFASLLPKDDSNVKEKVEKFLTSNKGGQMSWGVCMGASAGVALKKVSKIGVMKIGTLFIILQCANYLGYVDVDYKKLKRNLRNYLDIEQDAVFDTKDLSTMYQSAMKVLKAPSTCGFAAGFVLGFRFA